jgi:hypothetical protein
MPNYVKLSGGSLTLLATTLTLIFLKFEKSKSLVMLMPGVADV